MTTAPDLERLAPAELRQLRFVLSVLSLHQLVQLTSNVRRVCKRPGYGEIAIHIENGHPNGLKASRGYTFREEIQAEMLDELMSR